MTLTHEVFLRRFVEHVLPRGFPRIRYFGFLANRRRGVFLPLCRTLLAAAPPVEAAYSAEPAVRLCPCCQGPMRILEFLTAKQIRDEQIRQVPVLDTS
jgi:Putative transposase